jgi:hypothetical protein
MLLEKLIDQLVWNALVQWRVELISELEYCDPQSQTVLLLASHLRLGLPSWLQVQQRTLCIFNLPMLTTYLAHLILTVIFEDNGCGCCLLAWFTVRP